MDHTNTSLLCSLLSQRSQACPFPTSTQRFSVTVTSCAKQGTQTTANSKPDQKCQIHPPHPISFMACLTLIRILSTRLLFCKRDPRSKSEVLDSVCKIKKRLAGRWLAAQYCEYSWCHWVKAIMTRVLPHWKYIRYSKTRVFISIFAYRDWRMIKLHT